MTREQLVQEIYRLRSCLCVGLDPDVERMPPYLLQCEDPIFEFNRQIIDATQEFCVAYKPNLAFYESLGAQGWESFRKTVEYIPNNKLVISDAKRGDIGNTARRYAHTFFETYDTDAVTVAPYMGEDSVLPFLECEGKWTVLLALTSNTGSQDFQHHGSESGNPLFMEVLRKSAEWGSPEQLMYVVGATRADHLQAIRAIVPKHFLLVPGVGAQGGDLEEVMKAGAIEEECGLLINSSRGIIYAGQGEDFADKSREASRDIQRKMAFFL